VIPLAGWVAPFGDPGIADRSHLPRAFRSVPRPSSPLSAKASTRCPSLALDLFYSSAQPPRTTARPRSKLCPGPPCGRLASHEDTSPDTPPHRLSAGAGPVSASVTSQTLSSPFNQPPAPGNSPGRQFLLFSERGAKNRCQGWCQAGGGERDRTDDLLLAKQALSQLSYTPFQKTGIRHQSSEPLQF
jgi:hypothetical protein